MTVQDQPDAVPPASRMDALRSIDIIGNETHRKRAIALAIGILALTVIIMATNVPDLTFKKHMAIQKGLLFLSRAGLMISGGLFGYTLASDSQKELIKKHKVKFMFALVVSLILQEVLGELFSRSLKATNEYIGHNTYKWVASPNYGLYASSSVFAFTSGIFGGALLAAKKKDS